MTKTEVHDALLILRRPDEPDSQDNQLLRHVLQHDAVLRDYQIGAIIPCSPTPTDARRYCVAVARSLALVAANDADHGTIMFGGRLVYAC